MLFYIIEALKATLVAKNVRNVLQNWRSIQNIL